MRFRDRTEAGTALGATLRGHLGGDVVVVGLPRGGIPVAAEVARALDAPLDVLCVRKLGHPARPELGLGAIGEDGVRVLDDGLVARTGVTERMLAAVEARERTELDRQVHRFRPGGRPIPLTGRTVVIVDDGLATGGTARAAIGVARTRGARRVVLAVPVAAPDSAARLRPVVDDLVALVTPPGFTAVGACYDDFSPTSDDEVVAALRANAAPAGDDPGPPSHRRAEISIPCRDATLLGFLDVPSHARGVVVFVHGSGSSRHSSRNQAVAARLNQAGFATLLFDLLTSTEAADRRLVFDIDHLTTRLEDTLDWLDTRPELARLPIGLFGASTGAAAAVRVAAEPTSSVATVISRGGRVDLAGGALGAIRCPVLLIVGGADQPTLELNEAAARRLHAPFRLEVVPGAGHLFEEPGALGRVAALSAAWCTRVLGSEVTKVRTVPGGGLSRPGR
ncbi:MAG: alpha/beta family hydrolase [Acidimicrobiia bacterium]